VCVCDRLDSKFGTKYIHTVHTQTSVVKSVVIGSRITEFLSDEQG